MNLTGKKFKLWREYGALNSRPVFDAFANAVTSSGGIISNSTNYVDSDVHVIWSVLFHGRMASNRNIWNAVTASNKPIIVLEVGGIQRGTTWKVGLNGINRDAYFCDSGNTGERAQTLGLTVKPWRTTGEYILIAGQHDKSLQWQNQPSISNWFLKVYTEIRKHTLRPIIFRPHPRCRLPDIEHGLKYVYRQEPQHIDGTYDDFNMAFDNIFATINWSSNPGIHSVINGIPSFVSNHSLAYDVANDIDFLHDIENPLMLDRTQWLNDYAYTEWTAEEIAQGLPLKQLTHKLF
jgi:hypothetical protein